MTMQDNSNTAFGAFGAFGGVDPAALTYDDRGLLPVIAQDEMSGAVLMLAYANREAVEKTIATKLAHFWSRSRQELWLKGATSGNTLEVVELRADCDQDTLLLRVRPAGPACHLGTRSCFEPNPAEIELGWLWQILKQRQQDADASSYTSSPSYTVRLLAAGLPRVAQKVGEEAVETVIAALSSSADDRQSVVEEGADLLYHLLVLLLATGVEPARLGAELQRRQRQAASDGEGGET